MLRFGVSSILFLLLTVFTVILKPIASWRSDELQMFDLVEELQISFYEFLGVSKDDSMQAIKRAYRKLSLQMHPDKNVDDPTAADKFRQLVGVYEVLKDPELRENYNEVLVNGLPTWRTPVFYYRQLRRMSNLELFILFTVLATVVHYAALWGSVIDRRWTLEDQLSTSYKRHKLTDKKRETADIEITKQLKTIPGPRWHELLPFAMIKGFYWLLFDFAPQLVRYNVHHVKSTVKERIEAATAERLKLQLKAERQERKKRTAKEQQLSRKKIEQEAAELTASYQVLTLEGLPDSSTSESTGNEIRTCKEWSSEDVSALVRAVARYPGGVPGRWERISEVLERPVADVIAKAKDLGESKLNNIYKTDALFTCGGAFETNENDVCVDASDVESDSGNDLAMDGGSKQSKRQMKLSKKKSQDTQPKAVHEPDQSDTMELGTEVNPETIDSSITDDEPYLSRKKLKEAKSKLGEKKPVKPEAMVPMDTWTQAEQKQLEVAIKSFPKGTPARWDRIAECVPTKSKPEVLDRVKTLSVVARNNSQVVQ